MTRIYFSHHIVFLYDSAESVPGNDWTDDHVAQRFARRPAAANIATLIEDGWLEVQGGSPEVLDRCDRVVAVSIRSDSGAVAISGVDPTNHVVWRGRPGWVRVTVGQMRAAEEQVLQLFLTTEEAAAEEPTRVKEQGEWIRGGFVETAEHVRF